MLISDLLRGMKPPAILKTLFTGHAGRADVHQGIIKLLEICNSSIVLNDFLSQKAINKGLNSDQSMALSLRPTIWARSDDPTRATQSTDKSSSHSSVKTFAYRVWHSS